MIHSVHLCVNPSPTNPSIDNIVLIALSIELFLGNEIIGGQGLSN